MDDLISRQAVIDAFDCEKFDVGYCTEYGIGYNDGIDFAVSKLSDLPSAQQWIPCGERFPEFGRYAIVTTSWKFVTKAMYCGKYWEIDGIDYVKSAVIAWMPLPKPYKEKEE